MTQPIFFLLACLLPMVLRAQTPPALTITKSTKLARTKVYGQIVVTASDVVIDGNGAELHGPGTGGGKCEGVGILGKGVHGVTLRNLRVRGFAVGLQAEGCQRWTVEDCDFSDNFTDPEFGWGEQPDRGGILFVGMTQSVIAKSKGNRNWDGCHLRDCTGVSVRECQFSHCSNTCLKLWHTCGSEVRDNDLSRSEEHTSELQSLAYLVC